VPAVVGYAILRHISWIFLMPGPAMSCRYGLAKILDYPEIAFGRDIPKS